MWTVQFGRRLALTRGQALYSVRKLNGGTLEMRQKIPDDGFFLSVQDLTGIRADAVGCCDKEPMIDLFAIGFA